MTVANKRLAVAGHGQGSIVSRCQAIGLARSSFYYEPSGESALNLELMRLMDQEFTEHCFHGVIGMRDVLRLHGYWVNEKRVRRLMRLMGLEAVAPKPNLSKTASGHKVFPYLLRGLEIIGSNHVWSTDITYIAMPKGFLYLTAVMDWYSRYVLSWRISNTMDTAFCLEALHHALSQGKPTIFNTDQGSQYTSMEFTGTLLGNGIKVSMDGKGRWVDNVFVERLWRSVKYEHVYLYAYESVTEAREQLTGYFEFYNGERPHSALGARTPDAAYFDSTAVKLAA